LGADESFADKVAKGLRREGGVRVLSWEVVLRVPVGGLVVWQVGAVSRGSLGGCKVAGW